MASKIFLDANFLIDITLNREGAASANAVTQASMTLLLNYIPALPFCILLLISLLSFLAVGKPN